MVGVGEPPGEIGWIALRDCVRLPCLLMPPSCFVISCFADGDNQRFQIRRIRETGAQRHFLWVQKAMLMKNRSYIHLVGIASEKFDQLVQIVPTSAVRRDWSEFDVDRPVPCKCLPLLHLSTSASMKYV